MNAKTLALILSLSFLSCAFGKKRTGDIRVYDVRPSQGAMVRLQADEILLFEDIPDGDMKAMWNDEYRVLIDMANSCASED